MKIRASTPPRFDKTLAALLALLLLVRLAWVAGYPAIARVAPAWAWENNDGYETIARNVLATHTFGLAPGVPTAIRLPLYPGLIAAGYAVAGQRPGVVMLLQVLLSTLSGLALFRLAERLFDRRAAVASLLLFAAHPQANNFVFRCATETLFIFLVLEMVLAAVRHLQTGRRRDLALAAVWLGLSLLARPTFVWLGIVGLPALAWAGAGRGQPLRTRLFRAGWAAALLALIAAPWLVRNQIHSGRFPVLQTWVGQPLFQGAYVSSHLGEFLRGEKTVTDLDREALRLVAGKTRAFLRAAPPENRPLAREVLADRHARGLARAQLLEHPGATVLQVARNLALAPVLQMTWGSTWLLVLWNGPLLALAAAGVVRRFRENRRAFSGAIPVLVVYGFLHLMHAVVWPQARYVLPGLIPFSIFAGYFLSRRPGILRRPAA